MFTQGRIHQECGSPRIHIPYYTHTSSHTPGWVPTLPQVGHEYRTCPLVLLGQDNTICIVHVLLVEGNMDHVIIMYSLLERCGEDLTTSLWLTACTHPPSETSATVLHRLRSYGGWPSSPIVAIVKSWHSSTRHSCLHIRFFRLVNGQWFMCQVQTYSNRERAFNLGQIHQECSSLVYSVCTCI